MSGNYYPAYAPSWFLVYSVSSAHYDEITGTWYYLALGSRNGDKATFRQYGFALGPPHTAAVEFPIGIPVVHAIMMPAAGRLYIFGQSDRDIFWQDGPALGQSFAQKTVARFTQPVPPFRVLGKEVHDFLPVKYPDIFDREWRRATA